MRDIIVVVVLLGERSADADALNVLLSGEKVVEVAAFFLRHKLVYIGLDDDLLPRLGFGSNLSQIIDHRCAKVASGNRTKRDARNEFCYHRRYC